MLRVDKKGNLYDVNGSGEITNPNLVKSGNLAFGEYDPRAQKVMDKAEKQAVQEARKAAVKEYQKNVAEAKANNEAQKKAVVFKKAQREQAMNQVRAKNSVINQALTQPKIGLDFTTLVGNPLSGFNKKDRYISDINMRGLGHATKAQPAAHFGANTIYGGHEYDGYNKYDENMGNWASDLWQGAVGVVSTPIKVVKKVVVPIVLTHAQLLSRGIIAPVNVTKETVQHGLPGFTSQVGEEAEISSGLAGKIVFNKYTDPGYMFSKQVDITKKVPVVGDAYRTIDRYSGGFLTKAELASTVPGRLGRREPVTKAEIINAVVIGVMIGAVVLSGGSASVIIGMAASQMKQGPLGESELGRTLLTIAEVAALSYAAYSVATAGASSAAQAGASGTASTAGSGAAATGSAVAEQTAAQAVTNAVGTKVQSMAAEKAAVIVAEKTDTGIIGQIAVSSAIGPMTFKEVATQAGTNVALTEVGKKTGPIGLAIGQSAVAATYEVNADVDTTEANVGTSFSFAFQNQLENKVNAMAEEKAKEQLVKKLGEPSASVTMAAASGESLSDMPAKAYDNAQQKLINDQFNKAKAELAKMESQKLSLIAKVRNSPATAREQLINQAVELKASAVELEAKQNTLMIEAGMAPMKAQDKLTDNANTLGIKISKDADIALSNAKRIANGELVAKVYGEKVAILSQKYADASIAVTNKVGELKEMAEKVAALRAQGMTIEADDLEKAMGILNMLIMSLEADALAYAQAAEAEKLKGAVLTAAAQEGRYDPRFSVAHPMAQYGLA
jgi:hypothetical protein